MEIGLLVAFCLIAIVVGLTGCGQSKLTVFDSASNLGNSVGGAKKK